MHIRFSKSRKNKPPLLTCLRDDGTATWQASYDYFVHHDLIHYAVETTLRYRNAFWGLVAQGRDLDSFGTINGVKDNYPLEALWAEMIVGALQWPTIGGGESFTYADFEKTCAHAGLPPSTVTPEQWSQIVAAIASLHSQWQQVAQGDTLELEF